MFTYPSHTAVSSAKDKKEAKIASFKDVKNIINCRRIRFADVLVGQNNDGQQRSGVGSSSPASPEAYKLNGNCNDDNCDSLSKAEKARLNPSNNTDYGKNCEHAEKDTCI